MTLEEELDSSPKVSEHLSESDVFALATVLKRPRRLRSSPKIRSLVAETRVDRSRLVMPIFVSEGAGVKEKIPQMPGIYRISPDAQIEKEIQELENVGIKAVLLFGLPAKKDSFGTGAYNAQGVVQKAIERIKALNDDMLIVCDVCMCEYTNHGHCGIVDENTGLVDNDRTVEYLSRIALSQARAGADILAPSAMMDYQVGAIRSKLDANGYASVPIMAYSSKFASALYGPFREAAGSRPSFGDRKSYQMDPRNAREARREAELDIEQGADIIMVKPALPYLDLISAMKQRFNCPVAAYQVSGEYSMIKAAALKGWIDESLVVEETLNSIRRAGADIIISYFSKQYASEKKDLVTKE